MCYASIKIFNNLLRTFTSMMNEKAQCKKALSRYLNAHFFYSTDNLQGLKNLIILLSDYIMNWVLFYNTVCEILYL